MRRQFGDNFMQILQPEGWPRPSGYATGSAAEGRHVFVSGQVGWLPEGRFEATDMAGQIEQTLKNTVAVLAEAGAGPEHIVRMTWYVLDCDAYLDAVKQIGAAWREIIGRNYPAMAVVEVSRLVERQALVEIETTAVVPTT
jgi:enamine deaminase RidA (YjgF/YER057c/UK114 family)